jgi:TetR/AcrR family transcriptional repressor of nem operon
MRYAADHKDQSRERIINVAARQFRAKGSENVRVADVMKAAGLTHGGFYKHFSNKDQLLQEAVEEALTQIAAQLRKLADILSRPEALKLVIARYLSEGHMQHPELGCALAAMGTEMARMPRGMKLGISKALDAYADRLDFLMPGETAGQRRAAFLVLFPSMAGCIMAARAHASKERQKQILAAGRTFFEQAFCGEEAPAFLEKTQ